MASEQQGSKQQKSSKRRKTAYHHGDLRQALINEAVDIIASKDVGGLSLREVARRLNVSYAAPYHHFEDKTALLAAVATEGFHKMAAVMDRQMQVFENERRQRDDDCSSAASGTTEYSQTIALDRLAALGIGYVSFAAEHPSHYRVMFRDEYGEPEDFPELQRAREMCFGRLLQAVAEARQCAVDAEESFRYALVAWSTVHGLATLWNDGALRKKYGGQDVQGLAHWITDRLGVAIGDGICAGGST